VTVTGKLPVSGRGSAVLIVHHMSQAVTVPFGSAAAQAGSTVSFFVCGRISLLNVTT
jgi:hypothetical protein